MNAKTPKAAIAAIAALLVLSACSSQPEADTGTQPPPPPTPAEETTAVFDDGGDDGEDWNEYVSTPSAREDTQVAEQRAFNGTWRVFEADRWRSEEGCGCAEVDGGPELYPEGTEVALYVLEFNPRELNMNDQARLGEQAMWTLPALEVDATYLPSQRSAVLDDAGEQALEQVNIDQISRDEIAWLPQGLTGGQALSIDPGPGTTGTVWFALAYWIDPQARDIEMTLGGIVDAEQMPADHGQAWLTETLTVPIHPTGGQQ